MSTLYLALGDSMSIDDYAGGPGRGAASLLHRNRDDDFPGSAGRDLSSSGYDLQLLARDGAVSHDVLHRQLPQITRPPRLVTLTMGGNDLLSTYGDTATAHATVAELAVTGDAILSGLRDLGAEHIVMTTVYDPSDGTGDVRSPDLPPWPDGLAVIEALNSTLTGLARRHGALLADVHRQFIGHGVTAGDPAQPDARPARRDLWYCGHVEPNAWGAAAIRDVWWAALDAARLTGPPVSSPGQGSRARAASSPQ